jgi:sugar lactone lactonase YvrE
VVGITASLLAGSGVAAAQPYTLVHLAGSAGGPGISAGAGRAARLCGPAGIASDAAGNAFVADVCSSTIRKVTPAGVVTRYAGRSQVRGSADGNALTAAQFTAPMGVAVDASGTVFVADTGNHTIRKITAAGVVSTFAGAAGASGTADGSGAAARFNRPAGVAVNASGTVFVADTGNHTIRKITAAGVVTTLAGLAGSSGAIDGSATSARFFNPSSLAVTPAGDLLVTDTDNHTVRRVTPTGVVTTVAGLSGDPAAVDGAGPTARFAWPSGIAVDTAGTAFLTDTHNHTLRAITAAGQVVTLAGRAGVPGSADGSGAAARFFGPLGITVAAAGRLYVADSGNHTVRVSTLAGDVVTLAGQAPERGWADGDGTRALFAAPVGIAIDTAGSLYVSDSENHVIRKVSATGLVSTLAGSPGQSGSADGTGSMARFNRPAGLVLGTGGVLYVADADNHVIRKVTTSGVVTTLAGTAGKIGTANGTGAAARFHGPWALALDAAGVLYVADTWNHAIRKITAAGVVSTLAGSTSNEAGSANGVGTAARFSFPRGVVVRANGDLFVADAGNGVLRRVTAAGAVTTFSGVVGDTQVIDGVGATARFRFPSALALDGTNALLVGDVHAVRRVTLAGEVTTVLGSAVSSGTDDGGGPGRLDGAEGLAAAGGVIYLSDTGNNCIRRAAPGSTVLPTITSVTPASGPIGGGTTLTIRGTNFTASNVTVTLGGVTLSDVVVASPTEIVATVPAGTVGARSVEVTTFAGVATRSSAFTYERATRFLAEGATSAFFDVQLALLNPGTTSADARLTFQKTDGSSAQRTLSIPAHSRATVWPRQVSGMATAEFATVLDSDQPLVLDRTMTWDSRLGGYGTHAETSTASPATTWYLAEGATHSGFDLYYLLQNPSAAAAEVEVRFLLPDGVPPLVTRHTVGASSRFNLWVDGVPGLANTDVSAVIISTNGVPIIVERAMYLSAGGQFWAAGHNSAGIVAPSPEWFLAEGSTGAFFDLFVLIANPNAFAVIADVTYLLEGGTTLTRSYTLEPESRRTVWVDLEDPQLASAAVSAVVRARDGAGIIVERAMWWPGSTWVEAHNSPGTTATGTAWALAEGEYGGPRAVDTYVLIANTSPYAGQARMTLMFEDATTAVKTIDVAANSRTTVHVASQAEFAPSFRTATATTSRRFGVLVESVGSPEVRIVVERAMYSSDGGPRTFLPYWPAGTNAVGTRLR